MKGETFVGTIRKLDDNVNIIGTNLKRIRKELKINENDTFKICIKDNKIILIKNHNK